MADLAGSFYFSGANEDMLAERTAEQLNLINRDGIHPDVEWVSGRNAGGDVVLCARADDEASIRAVGAILKGRGILSAFEIIAATPDAETAATGAEPYYIIAADLYDVERDQLEESIDMEAALVDLGDMPVAFKAPLFN